MEESSDQRKIYEQHLQDVEEALEDPNCPNRSELLQLSSDLHELIGLISSNEDVLPAADVVDEHGNAAVCSRSEPKPQTDSLVGVPCLAPYGGVDVRMPLKYHGAILMDLEDGDEDSSGDPWVKVIYSNPLCRAMQPCKYFLDGSCNFGDKCRFSHGELLKLSDLRPYMKPDFENVEVGTRCLVRGDDYLWKLACVNDLYFDEAKVLVKACDTGFEDVKSFDEILPLNEENKWKCYLNFHRFHSKVSFFQTQAQVYPGIGLRFNGALANAECVLPVMHEASDSDEGEYVAPGFSSAGCANSGVTVGGWEKHTRGIGSKLMARMGYIAGEGLGKESRGRTEPVQVEIFPAGKSLDECLKIRLSRESRDPLQCVKVEKRKEKLKEQKISRSYLKSPQTDMFDFINTLVNFEGTAKADVTLKSGASLSGSAETLNVQLMNAEQAMNGASQRVESLKQSLRRSKGRGDKAAGRIIAVKLKSATEHLDACRKAVSKLRNDQRNLQEQNKLKAF